MIPLQLQRYFWEVDAKSLDPLLRKRYVIERLLEYGNEDAAAWLEQTYSKAEIADVVSKSRQLSPRPKHYWEFMLARHA